MGARQASARSTWRCSRISQTAMVTGRIEHIEMSLLEGPVPQRWWPTSWLSLRAFTMARNRTLTTAMTLCTPDRGLRMNHGVWLVHAARLVESGRSSTDPAGLGYAAVLSNKAPSLGLSPYMGRGCASLALPVLELPKEALPKQTTPPPPAPEAAPSTLTTTRRSLPCACQPSISLHLSVGSQNGRPASPSGFGTVPCLPDAQRSS